MRTLRAGIGVVVSLVALYLAFRGVDFAGVWRSLLRANYLLLALSAALVCLSIVFRALHLHRLFGVLNVGYLINNILPLRAGELARVVVLGQVETVSRVETLSTIVVERTVDTLAVILLLGVVAPLVPVPRAAVQPVLLLAAAAPLLAACWAAATRRAAAVRMVSWAARRLPCRIRAPAAQHADTAIDCLAVLRNPGAAAGVAGLTVLVYLTLAAAIQAVLAAVQVGLGGAGPFFLLAAASSGSSSRPLRAPSASGKES